MHVTEITVSAGITFNHPYEQYANFRPAVTLKASLGEDDDYKRCVSDLQRQANEIIEQRKTEIIAKCREEYESQEY